MSFLFIVGVTAISAFLLSYLRSGRFGTTVLALGAGYLLALLWTDALTQYRVMEVPFLSWHDAVYAGLIGLPGLAALFFSHKQKSLLPRLVAALAVALLVVTLLLPLFAKDPQGDKLYGVLLQYKEVIISMLLTLGLLDIVFSRSEKAPKHKEH